MARTKGTKDEQLAALRRRVREQQARLSRLECDEFVLKQRLGLAKVIIHKHTEGTASVLKTLRRMQLKMPTDTVLEEDIDKYIAYAGAANAYVEFFWTPTDYDSDESDESDDDDATANAAGTSSAATAEPGAIVSLDDVVRDD